LREYPLELENLKLKRDSLIRSNNIKLMLRD
jgi:hypothetical protein